MNILNRQLLIGVASISSVMASISLAAPPTTAPADMAGVISAEYTQYEWKNGDKPIRMLKRDEGFCFLTEIGGHFAGAGEVVRVSIGDDGYWYLAGASGQDELWGKAMGVKFSKAVKATVVKPTDPKTREWFGLLDELSNNPNPDIQFCIAVERKGLPKDADKTIELANIWEKSTRDLRADQRRIIETHVVWLYHRATAGLKGENYDKAMASIQETWFGIVNHQLGDLECWRKSKGKWSLKDNVIEGSGDSSMTLDSSMPADCTVEWQMRVVDGMRPRVLFDATDFFVGNEGFDRAIDAYGVANRRSIPATYELGDTMKVLVKFSGKKAELFINGNQIGAYERKN